MKQNFLDLNKFSVQLFSYTKYLSENFEDMHKFLLQKIKREKLLTIAVDQKMFL